MVAPSKVFQPPINCYHCSQSILHPGIGCFRYYLNNFHRDAVSCMKYYLPLLVTPLVMKYKDMDEDLLVKTLKFYSQTVCWSTLISTSAFCFVCTLRNFLGIFGKYTTLFIPTVLGMQYCWFFPPKLLKLFTIATSQAALETILRHFPSKLTRLILHSPAVQTILFMFNSAIVLHYKRKNVYKDYWFIQPYEKVVYKPSTEDLKMANLSIKEEITNEQQFLRKKCNHKHSTCMSFIMEGIKSYLVYGIPLDLLSMVMKSKVPKDTQGFMCRGLEKFKRFRPNMTGFFISYVGLYRLSSCLLRRYYAHLPLDLLHILSAFLGGFSYLYIRRTNILTLSMVISVQLLWLELCKNIKIAEKKNKKFNLALWIVRNAPLAQIIASLNVGYLVHIYFVNDQLVSSLARGFINGLTSNRLKNIRKFLINTDLQTLMNVAESNRTIKIFL